MPSFGFSFTNLPMHHVASIILLSLAHLVQTDVSHISGWHPCASCANNNFSLYKIEHRNITHSFTSVLVGHMYLRVHQLAHSRGSHIILHDQE